ncbi:MAG: hypothetical protein ABI851_13430 [Saprospiraceae bacterium]
MKSIFCVLISLFVIQNKIMSQNLKKFAGEYSFHKMELAAGFNFKSDGSFEFYYTYGASDRHATGTYSIVGDSLKLKSDKKAGEDFVINKQSKKAGMLEIHISAPNKILASSVECHCFSKDKRKDFEADQNGIIKADLKACDKIYLSHKYFPDIPSLIKDVDNDNNYFEVTLKQTLQEVSFQGIEFIIKENSISCMPNYFMPFDHIEFVKG